MPASNTGQLPESQAYAILDNAPDVIIRYSADGRYLYINKAGEKVAGHVSTEIIGKYPGEFGASEESTILLREMFSKVAGTKQPGNYEVRHGEIIFQSLVVPEFDKEGKVVSFITYLRDITALKNTEAALRASEKSFIDVFEASPTVTVISGMKDGRYLAVNRAFEEASGYDRSEVLGKTSEELGVFPEFDLRAKLLRELKGKGRVFGREILFRGKKGRSILGLTSIIPFIFRQQPCLLFVGVDITQRKQAEEALRESEALLDTFIDNTPIAMIIYSDDNKYIRLNRIAAELYGISPHAARGRSIFEVLPPGLASDVEKRNRKVSESGKASDIESYSARLPLRSAEVRTTYWEGYRFPVPLSGGKTGVGVVSLDITERVLAEEAMKTSEAQLNAFFENAPGILNLEDENLCYINTDKLTPSYFGLTRETIKGKCVKDLIPEFVRDFGGMMQHVIDTGEPNMNAEVQSPVPGKPGQIAYWRATYFRVPLGGGKWGVGLIGVEITDLKKAEDTLRRNEYELRTLVDNSPDLIFRLDRQSRYTYVNPAYERLTGIQRDRFIGRTNRELGMSPQMIGLWESASEEVMESGKDRVLEFDMESLFGKRYFYAQLIPEFARSGLVETVLVIARDISERRRNEEKIRYISFHDEVTGLFNRAFFEEEIRRVDTERELPVSIIMGDVNFLKLSNDVFGHREGDRLLKTIAGAIRNACRQGDIVARWGGDEFAVILPKTDPATVDGIRARIKQTVAGSGGTVVRPSIALGIATKEQRDQNIYRAIRRAEERMYDNKIAESRQNAGNVISKLMELAVERTQDLARHIKDTDVLARRFGKELALKEDQLKNLLLLIKMHDIGTAVVPEGILTRPGRLSKDEWELVKKHPEAGFRIVKSFSDTAKISDEVLSHDEHWDGTGYPRGLKGREIPYLARVFALIEAYDVMTHRRPYARAFSQEEALEEVRRNAGKQFDPDLAEKFVALLKPREREPALY